MLIHTLCRLPRWQETGLDCVEGTVSSLFLERYSDQLSKLPTENSIIALPVTMLTANTDIYLCIALCRGGVCSVCIHVCIPVFVPVNAHV